jgi:17beta-estradiol 17-dehydrogenase / very-long-chain 3-oxoacyl-CoA reductase
MPDVRKITSAIGWATVSFALLRLVNTICIYLLPSRISRYAHAAPNGNLPWALVTGASDGLGKAFVHELAAQRFNVVLHGRNHTKLSQVMSEVQLKYPSRSFRILIADASTVPCMRCVQHNQEQQQEQCQHQTTEGKTVSAAVDFTAIRAAVSDIYLTVLVNNVGDLPSNPVFAPVSDCSAHRIVGNVSVNALFPFHLMRELLSTLRHNGPALIINIGSMADAGWPLLASYSASKSFLMNASRTVRLEQVLEDNDVEILGLRVGRIDAGPVREPKESAFSAFPPNSHAVACAALDRAG